MLTNGRPLGFFTSVFQSAADRPIYAASASQTQSDLVVSRWSAEAGRPSLSASLETVQYPIFAAAHPAGQGRVYQAYASQAPSLVPDNGLLRIERPVEAARLVGMIGVCLRVSAVHLDDAPLAWNWKGEAPEGGWESVLPYLAKREHAPAHSWTFATPKALLGHPTAQGHCLIVCPGNSGVVLDKERPLLEEYANSPRRPVSAAAALLQPTGTLIEYGSLKDFGTCKHRRTQHISSVGLTVNNRRARGTGHMPHAKCRPLRCPSR